MTQIQFKGSGYVFTTTGTLETMICGECGIPFAMPEELLDWARKTPSVTWYCPNGHSRHFPGRTMEQKLRDAKEREQATRELLEHEQRSNAATRGHLTRKKKQLERVANGVCPCCSRHFTNLERHMTTKHPDFTTANASAVAPQNGPPPSQP